MEVEAKKEIHTLVEKIEKAYAANKFPDFIENIRFPFYKSLSPKAYISFNFPITILVGINGSGKSSALHAIYGCPDRSSTGDFWFSTPLDPIKTDRKKGNIPSIIYTYKINNELSEVIKRRSGVAKGLDYWETSRPILMYGMKPLEEGKRNPPIKKKVKFLDFRSQLSAFDKFFHFGEFKVRKTISSKQDYIRKYSGYVKTAFSTGKAHKVYRKSNEPLIRFGEQGAVVLSRILGKSYTACSILFHSFYGTEGATIVFNTNNKRYSEAFAGSGEFAVAKLVYEIITADEGSLIILDEPEVSLHPYAQERLKIFLLEYCLKKKLQIVISTHSPKLIEFLPDKAIKLFYEEDDGKFNILNVCSYFEAFHRIGEKINEANKKIILVEDKTAKLLLLKILQEIGGDYPILFNIVYFPGGAEHAKKSSAIYSQEKEFNKFLLLDGDKRNPHFDPDEFKVQDNNDLIFLKRKIKESTGLDFTSMSFKIDANSNGGNATQKKEIIRTYLKYQLSNVDYFPLNTPEELLWDEELAYQLLITLEKDNIEFSDDYKENFSLFAKLLFGENNSDAIERAQQIFINRFVEKKQKHYQIIVKILNKFHG